jgi:hypothetical protein
MIKQLWICSKDETTHKIVKLAILFLTIATAFKVTINALTSRFLKLTWGVIRRCEQLESYFLGKVLKK